MKVAVTAQDMTVDSAVDPRFGRARAFVVVDTTAGTSSVHDNAQNLNAAQGAGVQAARNVVDLGVEAVVTGHVGPKAFQVLQAGGVAVYTGAEGSVGEAVAALQAGRLKAAARPSVEGHWI